MKIFNNEISKSGERKAKNNRNKLAKKFKHNPKATYNFTSVPNEILGRTLGIQNLIISNSGKPIKREKSVIIGTIRMGYGHYRISMALASAAKSMGITPYWMDLMAHPDTTASKIINHLNNLYSLGSRLSQKSKLFNKFYWEPTTAESFKTLDFNAKDKMMSELMAPIFKNIDGNIPVVGSHSWATLAAIYGGHDRVINVIADNWPMGLHLAEGSMHTVQTHSSYMGYRTLKNMDSKKTVLNPIPADQIEMTGHYVDHELVHNIVKDTKNRIIRIKSGRPKRLLLSLGGAGAQAETYLKIINHLAREIKSEDVTIYFNVGDHKKRFDFIKKELEILKLKTSCYSNWEETKEFTKKALKSDMPGIHLFYNDDIFAAVYTTNMLMRASDLLISKPSEFSFYPIPKLMIQRIGGHEAWGAIHASEIGDGTVECENLPLTLQALDLLIKEGDLLIRQNNCILTQHSIGTYNGAYNVINLALGKKL